MLKETRKIRRGDVGYTVGRIYFPILISHFAIFVSNIDFVVQCIFDFLAIIARKEIVLHRALEIAPWLPFDAVSKVWRSGEHETRGAEVLTCDRHLVCYLRYRYLPSTPCIYLSTYPTYILLREPIGQPQVSAISLY